MKVDQSNLEAILMTIDGVMSLEVGSTDGPTLSEKINELSALMGSSATAVAMADYIYNVQMGIVLDGIDPRLKLSATDKKLILSAKLSKESYWLRYAERQNAALVHTLEGYRSVLSYLKEELKTINYGQSVR